MAKQAPGEAQPGRPPPRSEDANLYHQKSSDAPRSDRQTLSLSLFLSFFLAFFLSFLLSFGRDEGKGKSPLPLSLSLFLSFFRKG